VASSVVHIDEYFGAEFQEAALRLILFDPSFKMDISPEIFQDLVSRKILSIRASLYQQSKDDVPPTFMTLVTELRHRWKRLAVSATKRREDLRRAEARVRVLHKVPYPIGSENEFLRNKIENFIKRQLLRNALETSIGSWSEGNYSQAVDGINAAFEAGIRVTSSDLGLDYSDVEKRLAGYEDDGVDIARINIPLGLPTFDKHMRGGMELGTLGMCMGPTGKGKTMFLVKAGSCALSSGYDVVHITIGDVSSKVLSQRYDGCMAGIPVNALEQDPGSVIDKVRKALSGLRSRLYIKEYAAREASVSDIRSYLKVLEQQFAFRPHLIIVDYIDLLRPAEAVDSDNNMRYRLLGDLTIDLRTLGGEFHCAVWTASQTGKQSFRSRVISIADIWESLEKAQHADVLIGLCQTQFEETAGRLRLALLKNRLGGHQGTVLNCLVDVASQRISECQFQGPTIAP